VTLPLTKLLTKTEASQGGKKGAHSAKWEWTRQAELAFRKLKRTFTEAPILQYSDHATPIILQMATSGFTVPGILNQNDGFGVFRPVNFYSRKCSSAEHNYDTYDLELLAIVGTLKQWHYYLEGANHQVSFRCDHKNPEYFETSNVLSRRQPRWSETLSAYDFVIEHLEGSKNTADGPSRRPNYEIGYQRPVSRLLAIVSVEPYDNLMPAIMTVQASDLLAADIFAKLVDRPVADATDTVEEESQWTVVAGPLTYEGRLYIPAINHLRGKVITLFHDNPESGYFGALKTTEVVSRDFYWSAMDSHVCKHVSSCEVCHQIKAPRHIRHRINMPLETPSGPLEGVTMDSITYLPESTALGYTGILVIVDQLTKMAIYLPRRKDIDSPELAWLFFELCICKHGAPDIIVTDRGTQLHMD